MIQSISDLSNHTLNEFSPCIVKHGGACSIPQDNTLVMPNKHSKEINSSQISQMQIVFQVVKQLHNDRANQILD